MDIILNGKTYVAENVKARVFRQAIEIVENTDFNNLTVGSLDKLIDFVCTMYGGNFTRDEFYDGLDADELIPTLTAAINRVVNGVSEKIESKNE